MISSRGRGVRMKKLVKPRPLKDCTVAEREKPGRTNSPEVPPELLDTITQLDSLVKEIYNDSAPYKEARMVTDLLKEHGAQLETVMKDQLDSYFNTFRDILRKMRTRPLLCAYLLQLVEMRASGWESDSHTYRYYQKKLGELALRPETHHQRRTQSEGPTNHARPQLSEPLHSANYLASRCSAESYARDSNISVRSEWCSTGGASCWPFEKNLRNTSGNGSGEQCVSEQWSHQYSLEDNTDLAPSALPSNKQGHVSANNSNKNWSAQISLCKSYPSLKNSVMKPDEAVSEIPESAGEVINSAAKVVPGITKSRVVSSTYADDSRITTASNADVDDSDIPWVDSFEKSCMKVNEWQSKNAPVPLKLSITKAVLSNKKSTAREIISNSCHTVGAGMKPLTVQVENELYHRDCFTEDIDVSSVTSSEMDRESVASVASVSDNSVVDIISGAWRKSLRMDREKRTRSAAAKKKSTLFCVSRKDAETVLIPKVTGFIAAATSTFITQLAETNDSSIVVFEVTGDSRNRNRAIHLVADRCSESFVKLPSVKKPAGPTTSSPCKRSSSEHKVSSVSSISTMIPRSKHLPSLTEEYQLLAAPGGDSAKFSGDVIGLGLVENLAPVRLPDVKYQYKIFVKSEKMDRLLGPSGDRLKVVGQLTGTTIDIQERRGSDVWPVMISGKSNSSVRKAVEVIDDVLNKNVNPEKYVKYKTPCTELDDFLSIGCSRASPLSELPCDDKIQQQTGDINVLPVMPTGGSEHGSSLWYGVGKPADTCAPVGQLSSISDGGQESMSIICGESKADTTLLPTVTATFASSVLDDSDSVVFHYKVQVGNEFLVLTCPNRQLIKEAKEVLMSYFLSNERSPADVTTVDATRGLNTSFIEDSSSIADKVQSDSLSKTALDTRKLLSSTPHVLRSAGGTEQKPAVFRNNNNSSFLRPCQSVSSGSGLRVTPLVDYEILDNSRDEDFNNVVDIAHSTAIDMSETDSFQVRADTENLSSQMDNLSLHTKHDRGKLSFQVKPEGIGDFRPPTLMHAIPPVKQTEYIREESSRETRERCLSGKGKWVTLMRFPLQPHYSEKHIASIEANQPKGLGSAADRRYNFALTKKKRQAAARWTPNKKSEPSSREMRQYKREEILAIAQSDLAKVVPSDWKFLTAVLPEVCLEKNEHGFFDPASMWVICERSESLFANPFYRHRQRSARQGDTFPSYQAHSEQSPFSTTRDGSDIWSKAEQSVPVSRTKSYDNLSDVKPDNGSLTTLAHALLHEASKSCAAEDAEVRNISGLSVFATSSSRPSSVPLQLIQNTRPF